MATGRHSSPAALPQGERGRPWWLRGRTPAVLGAAAVMTAGVLSRAAAPAGIEVREAFADASNWEFDGGDWRCHGGMLTQNDWRVIPLAFYRGAEFGDVAVEVRFRVHSVGDGVKAAGLVLRSRTSRQAYRVHYDTKNSQVILLRWAGGDGRKELGRKRGVRMAPMSWHTARAVVAGSRIRVYLDGALVLEAADAALPAGRVGLYTSQGKVDFRDFRATGSPVKMQAKWRVEMAHEVPANQDLATIVETRVLCREPGRYIGWPTICRTRDNELLVVFSGDRNQHVCPWGVVQMVRSRDDGKTWSAPETICNTPLDDRDAGILQTRNGTLVMNWFTSLAFESAANGAWLRRLEPEEVLEQWRRHARKLTPEIRKRWLGNWTRRSLDDGKTWSAPVRRLGSSPHGGTELADGRLLMVGRGTFEGKLAMIVEESRDDGCSWQPIATIAPAPGESLAYYHEPHVIETAPGRLLAMFRFHFHEHKGARRDDKRSLLRQAESVDGGRTWTPAHPTPIQGYPPHLLRLADGTLVCVYGRRIPVFGEYACVSRDQGRTWDVEHEIHLAGAPNGDLGYPASVQLADGSIFTVYYQIYRQGEKTCLMGTRWRLK